MKILLFRRPAVAAAIVAITFSTAASAVAQITYVALGPNNSLQLRQMNADGTGDTGVALPFSTFVFPTWSRNGGQLAITASDPGRPDQRGQNVFSLNTANGALSQVTFFNDLQDPVERVFIRNFPYHKAVSPDGTAMAVFSQAQYAGDVGTATTTPILEIYSTLSALPPVQMHVDKGLNGKHHGGEGVDWSPTQNLLAAPVQGSANFLSGGGPGEITAIALFEPVAGAALQGRTRQLTFPRADGTAGQGNGAFLWGEHDYQPKFSPNGRGVAYVRSFQNFNLLSSSAPDPNIQSIRIVNVETGADREVIRFNPGLYVTTLSWSPDGTQLAFDLGQQLPGPLGLLQQVNPQTVEIYAVNVDGSNVRRLRGAGSGTPAWRPAVAQQPATFGNISTRLRVGTGDNALIGGFIVSGSGAKTVMVRALGPSLGAAGVQGALNDPVLELNGANGIIAANDNWQQAPNTCDIPNGFAPSDARESVLVTTLAPGSYTAVVRGAGGQTGIGLVEAYDLSAGGNSTLANISTRGDVQGGDDVLIGGFITVGGSTRVIVRALGPSLSGQGVPGALQDTTLELYDVNGAAVATNNDWQESQAVEIEGTSIPPADPRESAIVRNLAPGAYTAIVRGNNGTTGVALVEVYNLQ